MRRIKKLITKILPKRFVFCYSRYNSYNSNILTRFRAALKGFCADEWILYDLDNNNPKDYLSEFDRRNFREVASSYKILFDNKMLFHKMMKGIAPINKLYAYKAYGEYVIVETGFTLSNILKKIKELSILVYKPTFDGGGGKGFALLGYSNGSFTINRKVSTEGSIIELLEKSDNYMIEEYCKQSEFENCIFRDAVNTLRIITVDDNGEYKVPVVMQRMGAVKDACADNASLGGLFCKVDEITGKLSVAYSYDHSLLFNESGQMKSLSHHPISGIKLEGLEIPNFDFIKSEACRIHKAIRYTGAKFVAWDFALTEDGYRVIEGNTSSGMRLVQCYGGVKRSYLGNWMKENGFIR